MAEVINFTPKNVTPKTYTFKYKDHVITVGYDPDSLRWHWSFTHRYTFRGSMISSDYSGDSASTGRAEIAAKKMLDKVLGYV